MKIAIIIILCLLLVNQITMAKTKQPEIFYQNPMGGDGGGGGGNQGEIKKAIKKQITSNGQLDVDKLVNYLAEIERKL
jgi:hypothetical protein